MKALSIKQPWASLIAHGIKDIENRTWSTRYRGRIYIHASGQPSFNNIIRGLAHDQMDEFVKSDSGLYLDARHEAYPKMAIIGEVDVVDCVINHSSIWAEATFYPIDETEGYPNNVLPIYNWVLANPVLYDKPILNVKGKLSLWEFKESEVSNG